MIDAQLITHSSCSESVCIALRIVAASDGTSGFFFAAFILANDCFGLCALICAGLHWIVAVNSRTWIAAAALHLAHPI